MEPHSPLHSDETRGRAMRSRTGASAPKKEMSAAGAAAAAAADTAAARGIHFERYYTQPGVDPFDTVEWELRDAVISNEKGEKVFEQKGVEMPKFWSQTATNVVVSKYFRGQLGTPERERSVRQLIGRVVDTLAGWGRQNGYFASEADALTYHAELKHILLYQYACFNSPVWFNVGIEEKPQCSACFINSAEDTMDSILTLAKTEGMLFKYGSGTGSNLSKLRSAKEPLAGGGTASGPGLLHEGLRRLRRRHQERRQDPAGGQDGHPGRRPPGHRGVHPLQGGRGAQGLGPDRRGLRGRLQRRRRRLRLDRLPERQPLRARDRRLHAGRRGRRRVADQGPHRRASPWAPSRPATS